MSKFLFCNDFAEFRTRERLMWGAAGFPDNGLTERISEPITPWGDDLAETCYLEVPDDLARALSRALQGQLVDRLPAQYLPDDVSDRATFRNKEQRRLARRSIYKRDHE